jgi:hypothetical protein
LLHALGNVKVFPGVIPLRKNFEVWQYQNITNYTTKVQLSINACFVELQLIVLNAL